MRASSSGRAPGTIESLNHGPDEHDAEPEPSDTQRLARAAKAGDAARFAELYERIAPALFTWASLRIRPAMRTALDPQDVVQEVWCRAWKSFERYDANATPFRLWVFRIAKNVLLEGFRKLRRSGDPAAGPTTRLFQLQNLPDSATAVSRKMARHEGIAALLAWAETLPEEDRQLFVHCGLEGLSYAEVGERMQLQRDTVAKRWQTLRARVVHFGAPRDLTAND
ncbi:MAG: sigma-70 family RNA polymerase sigma factor [Planctomycetota bacterium]|nr:sigma-70 family RNA polymerase sigma factor [Planctomycetota bacterium]